MSKLLIVGNGFDLSCGLKSSYNDFFHWQLEKSQAFATYYNARNKRTFFVGVYPAFGGKALTEELTVWDMYFISLKQTDSWCDIEKALQSSFFGSGFWQKILGKINTICNAYNNQQLSNTEVGEIEYYIWEYVLNQKAPMEDKNFGVYTKKIEFSSDEFYSLLLNQLELFESKFRKYISEQAQNGNYYLSAKELTRKLLNLKDADIDTGGYIYVMNFNYTKPFRKDLMTIRKMIHICDNVHGSLESDYSIFGIDSEYRNTNGLLEQVSQNVPAYNFTKQRRRIVKMAEGKENPRVTNNEYKELIFYGHSLNEQDYSYFHTLFDLCNLYGSELKLTFYYKEYGETTERNKRIRETRITEVLALLGRYGETLSNKAHGRNLIDKLHNERRLLIKAI